MEIERQYQLLSFDAFEHLCKEADHISNTRLFLDFLHHSGEVVWPPDYFDKQVILDQAWVLDTIYTIFNRDGRYD